MCICRYVSLPRPICFEEGQNYTVHVNLPYYSSHSDHHAPFIFIDSVGTHTHTHTITHTRTNTHIHTHMHTHTLSVKYAYHAVIELLCMPSHQSSPLCRSRPQF